MATKKGLKFNVTPEEISYTSISKSQNYNSATIGIKRGDNEYMSINYEWSGDGTPDFVMDLMGFMQAAKKKTTVSGSMGFLPPWRDKH